MPSRMSATVRMAPAADLRTLVPISVSSDPKGGVDAEQVGQQNFDAERADEPSSYAQDENDAAALGDSEPADQTHRDAYDDVRDGYLISQRHSGTSSATNGSISILKRRSSNTRPTPLRPILPSRSFDEAYYKQHNDCADRGIDDRGNDAAADVDAEPRQQPAADQSADNADNNIADKAEATTGHNLARKPARNSTDDQPDN
jgi:hypothetical protein